MKFNKKGASLSGWTETALFTMIFILGIIWASGGLNMMYGKSYDFSFGIIPNDTINSFTTSADSLITQTSDSQATFTQNEGLTLASLWSMIKGIFNVVATFLTGGFIERAVYLAHGPLWLGSILRLVFLFSLAFIIIKLLTKVRP